MKGRQGLSFFKSYIMKLFRNLYVITLLLLGSSFLMAQSPFQLDTTFRVDLNGQSHNYHPHVGDFFIEDDGSIIMVGGFQHFPYPIKYPQFVVKLHRDGQLDNQFNYGHPSGTYGISRITRHNGMYYLGHQSNPGVSRIFPDGTADTSFRFPINSFFGHAVQIGDIHVLADGKVLVCGIFLTSPAGGYGILRLHQDGSIDTTFYSPFVDKWLDHILPLPDGKYLIGGVKYDMQMTRSSVWRIHPDGELDTTFNTGSIGGVCFYADTVAGTNKFIVTGEMIIPGISGSVKIARLNSDGSLDSTFFYLNQFSYNQFVGYPGPFIYLGNKMLVGGEYHAINGKLYNCLAVFDTNGLLDTLLSAGLPGPDSTAPYYKYPGTKNFGLQDDKIVVQGVFNCYNGFSSFGMVRLHGLTAGMRELEEEDRMRCFPNPVSDHVNVTLHQPLRGSYQIMDLSGRLLHSGMLQPAQASHRIGLPPLPSGVYLLQVSSKDGRAFCEKLVVTRP